MVNSLTRFGVQQDDAAYCSYVDMSSGKLRKPAITRKPRKFLTLRSSRDAHSGRNLKRVAMLLRRYRFSHHGKSCVGIVRVRMPCREDDPGLIVCDRSLTTLGR